MLINEYNTLKEEMLSKISEEEIELKEEGLISTYSLEQNYPNPFNPATTINYQLPKDGFVTLKIYDILGRYSADFNASNLASGTYIYEMRSKDFKAVKKLMLLK